MAFGKKKEEDGVAVDPAAEADDSLSGVFASAEAEAEADPEPAPDPLAPTPEPPPAADAGALGGADALLSMFQTTEAEGADRTAILQLAGDVALDDLLEEMHTLASALGISSTSIT